MTTMTITTAPAARSPRRPTPLTRPLIAATVEPTCTDRMCPHDGHGRGHHADPCSLCHRHDCDLDCVPRSSR